MELLNDRKFLLMLAMFLVLSACIVLFAASAGLLLMFALLFFGSLCLVWKEPHIKLAGLAFLVMLSLLNIGLNGMKFGIDFVGGTRIPVILEHSVDTQTMDEMVQTIKGRVGGLGLKEAKVRALGSTQIMVEIPNSTQKEIEFIEETLSAQGVYWGVIDGRIAISGDHIFSSSIRAMRSNELAYQRGADWGVEFSVDREGAEQFGKAAKGKADYPVYMFLDRPNDAAVFLSKAELRKGMLDDSSEKEALNALRQALKLDGERDISISIMENIDNETPKPKTNRTKAILSKSAPQYIKDRLVDAGYTLKEVEADAITLSYNRTNSGVLIVSKMEGIGLMSSPILSAGLTSGTPQYSMSITGGAGGVSGSAERINEATRRVKYIISILKGGSLPVGISLGSKTTLPATLGSEFLKLSMIGLAASLVVISIFIGIRYKNMRATAPIVAISISELIILLSILGSFTIDLAAMAGIIAAIGIGVDAQIVITDEILKKDEEAIEERIEYAFAIIKTNVVVAALSMVPLLFSNLIEVIAFAISTILGSLLGYLLSRPAYAAIMKLIIKDADTKT